MNSLFVPAEFDIPRDLEGPGFRLEPLGPAHNERDHDAWMSSIDHIRATPGYEQSDWPKPMTLEANRSDLIGHAADFANRTGFTFSVVDGDEVIGCVYIYPARTTPNDVWVKSWVRESRAELDVIVWREVSDWLASSWPFRSPEYAARG